MQTITAWGCPNAVVISDLSDTKQYTIRMVNRKIGALNGVEKISSSES